VTFQHPSILDSDAYSRAGLRSPLYALIIGINKYASPEIYDLKGAVPDALSMKQYLESDLGVPPSQIRFLCNAEATRSAIIQEFNSLVADQRIHRGDPILIFFAGHGGEVDAPTDWEAGGGKIQMLIPHDFQANVDSRVTHGIPTHRTIGTLLSRIAEKWGNNIVRLPKLYSIVHLNDRIVRTDCHLRLLSLGIWHPCCIRIRPYGTGH
jgi:hypothetical protein